MNTNNQNQQSGASPFVGTILENSYMPVLFKGSDKDKNNWALPAGTLLNSFTMGVLPKVGLGISAIAIAPPLFQVLLWTFLSPLPFRSLSNRKRLEDTKDQYNKFISTSKECFAKYKTEHELYLQAIQEDIDNINKAKPMMKYTLRKLAEKLRANGIAASYTDPEMEHIDFRKFPVNDAYDLVTTKQLKFEQEMSGWWPEIQGVILAANPLTMMILQLMNDRKIKNLQKKKADLMKLQKHNEELMVADLTHLRDFEAALKNVAMIYRDIEEILTGIMDKLLGELEYKYAGINKMPKEKVDTIQAIKDILKNLAEKKIVAQGTIDTTVKNALKHSNDLSKRHNRLKTEILNLKESA